MTRYILNHYTSKKKKKMRGGESVSIPSHTHMCNTQVNTKTHLEGSGSAEMLYIQCS